MNAKKAKNANSFETISRKQNKAKRREKDIPENINLLSLSNDSYSILISRKSEKLTWKDYLWKTSYKAKHRKNCECCPGHYLSTSVY